MQSSELASRLECLTKKELVQLVVGCNQNHRNVAGYVMNELKKMTDNILIERDKAYKGYLKEDGLSEKLKQQADSQNGKDKIDILKSSMRHYLAGQKQLKRYKKLSSQLNELGLPYEGEEIA